MVLASGVDYTVIAVYMILMLVIGVVLSRFNKNDSDFFKSSNKMSWWLAGLSLFMSSFSVWSFTGAAGLAYRVPAFALCMYLMNGLAMIFGVWFMAARWRRSRSTTIMSYLSERYGVSTNQLYSWTMLLATLIQGGIQLLALGKFVSVAMGTDLKATIIVCGLVISIYCLIGGLWAVVVTDTLQFMVLFPTALIVMFLGFHEIGGISSLATRVPEGFWHIQTQEYDWLYLLAYWIVMSFALNSGALSQRYFSVKNEKEARKVAILTMVLLTVAPAVWLLPPIFSRILGLDLASITLGLNAPEEAAYVAFCLKFLPHGAIGIMLAAMLSATMSSLSSTFNAYAAVITEDIIKQIFWKDASGKLLLFIGRLTTLLFGGLVIWAAIAQADIKGGVFGLMMTFSGVMIIPSGIPLVIGLIYRATPRWAGIASYLSGVLAGVLYLLLFKGGTFTGQAFCTGGTSALVYFLPGFFIKAKGEYKKSVDKFFQKLATPISGAEVGDTQITDVGSFRITGWATIGMGLGAVSLALLDLPFGGRMINLAIGASLTAIGALLLAVCKYAVRKRNV
ncbi:MAG TPA: hypothetical protein VM123_02325 [archaeon]|nr:hypothetical protein [archaeon]